MSMSFHSQKLSRGLLKLALGLALTASTHSVLADAQRAAKLYDQALQRFQQNDLPGASVLLRNALQQDRRNLAANLLLGRVLVASGDLKAAEASLEEAARLGVSNAEVWPLLGQVWLQLGESRKVLQTMTVAAVPADRQADILMLRGAALAFEGDISNASAQFAEAKKLAPTNAGPWIAETPLLLRAGDRERALASGRKAVELAPGNSMAWYQLATVQQALGDTAASMVSIDKALAIQPKLVDALVVKASLLLSTNKRREAADLLVRLRTEGVVEPRASFLRAVLAESSGNSNQARSEYADAAARIDAMAPGARSSSEPLLLAGALAHRALGNAEQARAYTEQLLARNPRHAVAAPLLPRLLLDAGDVTKAASALDTLLRQNPNDPDLLMLLGSVHLARRQYAQASEAFERASRGGAGNAALRELALSQLGLRRDQQALGNLERAYAQNPRDTRAGIELAIFYARRGEAAKALKVADALVAQDPSNPVLLNFLANVKGRLGDNPGMRAAYERVLAVEPKFRITIINLSLLDIDERKLDAARARLEAWFNANPNDAEAAYLIGMVEERARRPAKALQVWAKVDSMQARDPRAGLASIDLLLNQRRGNEALALARSLAGRHPDSGPVQMSLARAQLALGDSAGARASLQVAARLVGFEPLQLVTVARLQLAAGHVDGASNSVAKALQAEPEHHAAMIARVEVAARRGDTAGVDAGMKALQAKHGGKVATQLTAGHLALSRKQFAQAIDHYANAHRQEPGTPTALALSQAHLLSGAGPKALAVLEENARLQPQDPIALRALAEVQLHQGRNDAAVKSFEQLVAAQPEDADLAITFAQVLAASKDSRAVATAERALKLAPSNAQILAGYGGVLVQAGQAETAVRILREARLREPADIGLRLQLASALAKTGRRAEAQEELKAALSAQPALNTDPGVAALRGELGL